MASCTTVDYPSNSLGAWFPPECDGDPNAVITHMQAERGNLSGFFQENIVTDDPFLFVLQATKKEFPDGMGDHITMPVFNAARPSERDVVNWAKVGHARSGYTPCKVEYKEIPYGSRRVTACMMQDGWKSPVFCKVDLMLKYRWNEQLGAILSVMRSWTRDIWSFWSRHAYCKAVKNTVLSAAYGHPEKVGEYPSCNPTTKLTWNHLEMLYPKIRYSVSALGTKINGSEMIFIGDHELKVLEEEYMLKQERLGLRAPEIYLPELGVTAKKIGKYLLIPVGHPRRFRDRLAGETWEDALIPSFINKEDGEFGVETIENPDYRNPAVAKYSETIWFNADAFTWLTPPMAIQSATQHYPAHNYSGDFELIIPPKGANACDPKSKNMYFAADFMSGGFSMNPGRGRCVLSLAAFECPCDIVDVCDGPAPVCDPQWAIHKCCASLVVGELHLVIKGELPDTCPIGSSLYIVTETGQAHLITAVVAQTPYPGDGVTPAGTAVIIRFPVGQEDEATCRDCDPWKFIKCMTPQSCIALDQSGCLSCVDDEAPVGVAGNRCIATFATDQLPEAAPAVVAPATPGAVQTQLQAWLTANGGGTATVVFSGAPEYVWDIEIEGNAGAANVLAFTYDDAQGEPVVVPLTCNNP